MPPTEPTPIRIDSHQHVWRIDRGDYGWLTPRHKALYRDFTAIWGATARRFYRLE